MLTEGIHAVKAGKVSEAADLLARYVRENPEDAAGWLWLGYCLQDRAKATYCMRKAMELDPTNMEAINLISSLPELVSQPAYR